MKTTHLKNRQNGRILPWTPILAKNPNMIPCNEAGEINIIVDEDMANRDMNRPKTRYLGNPENGRLLDWTPILAKRADLIPVNSPDEWNAWQQNTQAVDSLKQSDTPAPVSLSRETSIVRPDVDSAQESAVTPVPPAGGEVKPVGQVPAADSTITVPDVSGMDRFPAKEKLVMWAVDTFGVKLSLRTKLETVQEQCQQLVDGTYVAEAAGGN